MGAQHSEENHDHIEQNLQVLSIIIVSGAGTSAVNGVYAFANETKGSRPVWMQIGRDKACKICWSSNGFWTLRDISDNSLYFVSDRSDFVLPINAEWSSFQERGQAPMPTLMCQALSSVIISNAGTADVNGVYLLCNETKGERPVWTKAGSANWKIQWSDQNSWWMIDNIEGRSPYCIPNCSDRTPLAKDHSWSTYMDGVEPMPMIVSRVRSHIIVSGAGTAVVNGMYAPSNEARGGRPVWKHIQRPNVSIHWSVQSGAWVMEASGFTRPGEGAPYQIPNRWDPTPPSDENWEEINNGLGPPPSIRFLALCSIVLSSASIPEVNGVYVPIDEAEGDRPVWSQLGDPSYKIHWLPSEDCWVIRHLQDGVKYYSSTIGCLPGDVDYDPTPTHVEWVQYTPKMNVDAEHEQAAHVAKHPQTPPPEKRDDFSAQAYIGQIVECRMTGGEWAAGVVTSIGPVRVRRTVGHHQEERQWDEVRPTLASEEVEARQQVVAGGLLAQALASHIDGGSMGSMAHVPPSASREVTPQPTDRPFGGGQQEASTSKQLGKVASWLSSQQHHQNPVPTIRGLGAESTAQQHSNEMVFPPASHAVSESSQSLGARKPQHDLRMPMSYSSTSGLSMGSGSIGAVSPNQPITSLPGRGASLATLPGRGVETTTSWGHGSRHGSHVASTGELSHCHSTGTLNPSMAGSVHAVGWASTQSLSCVTQSLSCVTLPGATAMRSKGASLPNLKENYSLPLALSSVRSQLPQSMHVGQEGNPSPGRQPPSPGSFVLRQSTPRPTSSAQSSVSLSMSLRSMPVPTPRLGTTYGAPVSVNRIVAQPSLMTAPRPRGVQFTNSAITAGSPMSSAYSIAATLPPSMPMIPRSMHPSAMLQYNPTGSQYNLKPKATPNDDGNNAAPVSN